MNVVAHASAPAAAVGSQVTSVPRFFVTAVVASASAEIMYCSTSAGDICSAAALLSNPSRVSSLGKSSAGLDVSPSKSRTVLLYSNRLRRLTKLGPGLVTVGSQARGCAPGPPSTPPRAPGSFEPFGPFAPLGKSDFSGSPMDPFEQPIATAQDSTKHSLHRRLV